MCAEAERWNHNIHYQSVILRVVPDGCRSALDVGCGEGLLARDLRRVVPEVTGIDADAASIDLARRQHAGAGVTYVLDDFRMYPFAPESFDLVASVAALHHMDTAAALERMRTLLRPGGVLAIVGLARNRSPADLAFEVAGRVAHRWYLRSRTYWEHSAPVVWPPPQTYRQIRRTAGHVLPGVRYRRHPMWRYSLVWTKPSR